MSAAMSVAPSSHPSRPYSPYRAPTFSDGSRGQPFLPEKPFTVAIAPPRKKFGATTYWNISWIFGFKERFSLAFLVVFGGALIGFCLARTIMFNPKNVQNLTIPGEWHWYQKKVYKPSLFIHIYCTIPGGIIAVFQFIPGIRRRAMLFHRINGYVALFLVTLGTLGGTIVARRAFGGELNAQSGYYILSSLIVGCAAMGLANKHETRKHRKWMLRTVTFVAAPITTRLIMFAARQIITDVGTYYSVWRCDEIMSVIDAQTVSAKFPQCLQTDTNPGNINVAVHAATGADRLSFASSVRATFGMALWLAMMIHLICVEFYIRKTESENQHRRGYVLERSDDDTDVKRAPDDN
jgi:hypothetical protein